jgi:hypothetical protein
MIDNHKLLLIQILLNNNMKNIRLRIPLQSKHMKHHKVIKIICYFLTYILY